MRTELLKQGQDIGNNIKHTYQMTYVRTLPYHAYLVQKLPCHLFINIKDERGNTVAPCIWMNHNKCMTNLQLSKGDIIVLEAYAEKYNLGGEYHPNNVYRGKHKIFRLLYPSNAMKIGVELIPYSKILDLKTLKLYDNYEEYTIGAGINSEENYSYTFIHLMDNVLIENLFNRRGNVISKDYPIRCIYLDVWTCLTEEQRAKILDCRHYTYSQVLDYQKMMKEL